MNTHIRSLHAEDLLAAAEIEMQGAGWSIDQLHASLSLTHTLGLAATKDAQLVGHLLATHVIDEGELITIGVSQGHRRQGVARLLLEALRNRWSNHGVQTAFLEVRHDNQAARALFQNSRWIPTGRRPRYYSDGADAVLMSLEVR